jgi:hypothetical protein
MTANNKKYHITETLNDFDAVSLYPSAMARMGFLKGKPKVLSLEQLNMDFLNSVDGYFIEIDNITVNKKLHFPLRSVLLKSGVKNYVNEFESSIYIDKIGLEDFIQYQNAEFNIVRGYYYNEGKNEKIRETIAYCFNERLKKKQEKNPIELVYKLLMNASYGKMIQKEIKTNLKFTNTKAKHESFLSHNHNYIKEYHEIAKDKYVYTVQKSVNTHFSLPQVGIEILSMSKRIMNEVMCLAEDLFIDIYYQDTDSMHIKDSQIKELAEAFESKFGRKLIGKNMGQFHSDFEDAATSVESYFLGKKAYIDKLSTGKYHIRMKGISEKAIRAKGEPLSLYKKLYDGKTLKFDLATGKPSFNRNKNFSYTTNQTFIRKVKF